MPNFQIGRRGRVYMIEEASYGDAASAFAAGDAVRHLTVALNDPRLRVDSPERYGHPSLLDKFSRRRNGSTWTVGGIFYPSGVLNTLPDHSLVVKNALGATPSNITLATTLSGTPTTTTGTVASGTGLAVGQGVLISIAAGASAGKYVRIITGIVGGVDLTWAPALPAAPVAGDAVKGCVTYTLATQIQKSLSMLRCLDNVRFQGMGLVIDRFKLTFDGNDELRWEASGPFQKRLRDASAAADPVTFTVVGSNPPSGLLGDFFTDGAHSCMTRAEIELTNAMVLDNTCFGNGGFAEGYFRNDKRSVSVMVNRQFDDVMTLMTAAENSANLNALIQCGDVEGSIVAAYMPKVELEVPDDADTEQVIQHSYRGTAKGTDGNDELTVVVA